jgi:hypothetical protein
MMIITVILDKKIVNGMDTTYCLIKQFTFKSRYAKFNPINNITS